jgi:hypothetical protein
VEAYAHQARQRGPEEAAGVAPATPPGAATDLAIVRGLAKVLDSALTIPGTRAKIGLDSILGLIPGVGDLGSAAIGGYILMVASKLGVPAVVLWRMLLNLAIDAVFGLVPFAGDLFDVAFKANTKNAALLERALADPAGTRRASRWALVTVGLGFLAVSAAGVIGMIYLVRWLIA